VAWIDSLFRRMQELNASDLHMTSTVKPRLRIHGDMLPIEECPELSPEQLKQVIYEVAPKRNQTEFETDHDTDFAYELAGVGRFRANFFVDRKGPGAVFRLIPNEILTVEKLGLPKSVVDLCFLTKGLVVVTGPTGSGKSTTLSALVDHINKNRADHIITIEDPIEFVHADKKCMINQREVGRHTNGFKRALRAALREDPDIILVGEMRDLETIEIAIETAETGHLVFGTLHTTTAASTVDRIIDQFPADRQAQIRVMLSESLKGVISQMLCKKIGGGRVAAREILLTTPAISNLIREGKTFQIPSIIQTSKKLGMLTLNDALLELVEKKVIDPDEAFVRSVEKSGLVASLKAKGFKVSLSAES
jgi:twitching motility protein PilT